MTNTPCIRVKNFELRVKIFEFLDENFELRISAQVKSSFPRCVVLHSVIIGYERLYDDMGDVPVNLSTCQH